MNKIIVFIFSCAVAWSHTSYAAVQNVTGGVPVAIDADGIADGVSFTAQGVTPSTLLVGDGENVNNNGNASGIASDSSNASTVTFQGSTGTSIVNGTVGAINPLLKINGGLGSSTIIFNGVVSSATFDVTGNGTVQFNTTANAALTFNTDGNLIIGGGATFNGAVNNLAANTGTLTLNNASILNGAVGGAVGALKQVNVIGGNATVNGSLSARNFSLGTNTLTLTGALALPTGATFNTTVISDTLFGNIFAAGQNDNISAAVVTVNADASQALLTGAPLFVVNAGAGTSGVPVVVNSSSVRYSFIGNNLNGSITITPSLIPLTTITSNPSAVGAGTVLDALIPIAAANPGSDLAFIETQLSGLPTSAAYADALLQIAPASGLIGIGRESFNTTKQFQKIWLEHLQQNRRCAFFENCCDPCEDVCCDPCVRGCDGMQLWGNSFGYYGHQDNEDGYNGYKVNTWGATIAAEMPLDCGFRTGLGLGYAYTDLDQRDFGNNTDFHNYQGTLYLSYDMDSWFADGGFSFGWNRYDGRRHIVFGEVNRTARAKYDGREYTGFLVAGYQYNCNCMEFTPYASILYSNLHLDAYTEKGADSLNLHIKKQDYNYVESALGLKFAYLWETSCGTYIPELHTAWLHDFDVDGLDATASFTGIGAAGGTFKNKGPRFDRNTWNIGGSITCLSSDDLMIQIVYDYERSRSYFDHQGQLQLSYDF